MTDYRKAYGLPERYFLSLGRMVEKKNLATLIAAYAKFSEGSRGLARRPLGNRVTSDESARQTPASLVFVGSGELEGSLKEQARDLGLTVIDHSSWKAGESSETRDQQLATRDEENRGTVFFYGFRQIEENAVFYALAEAFVLPSLYEEWGLVVNEAMAAGLPVIVSRTAGCAEDLLPAGGQVTSDEWQVASKGSENCKLTTDGSLEQRSNGFVFDPTSSDALSEALRCVAESEDRRWETGKRSREIVAKFSCGNFARQAMRAARAARGSGCESGW